MEHARADQFLAAPRRVVPGNRDFIDTGTESRQVSPCPPVDGTAVRDRRALQAMMDREAAAAR